MITEKNLLMKRVKKLTVL